MSRIAVITDSNSGINFEDAKELGIKVLPMPFLIDGKTYFEEISLSQEEFFEKLENDVDISTSQPSPESVMKIWDEALEEADEVVYIPMSSGLSSSCHTALIMMEKFRLLITREYLSHSVSQCLMLWNLQKEDLRQFR